MERYDQYPIALLTIKINCNGVRWCSAMSYRNRACVSGALLHGLNWCEIV